MGKNQRLVLVIDDDPDFQALVAWMLQQHGCVSRAATGMSDIDGALAGSVPQAILLDWQLGDVDGTTLIERLRRQYPSSPIVFTTGYSSQEVAAAAIKLGAFDFLTKPLDDAKFTITISKATEHFELLTRLHNLELGSDESGFEGLIGISPQMRNVYSMIRNVAPTDVNVMVCGESGTGKELVAIAIHACSERSAGPYVAQNMASIPGDLAEATLFGHEKGAFSGADRARAGAVGEATGGTLFLDEITEMPLVLQSKLLRFLQERTYRPVGGAKDLKADARIVSATNRDPAEAVRDKKLREDLYYRLNVVPILLPPLRERNGDVPLLVTHMLRRFARQYAKKFERVDPLAMKALEGYQWPGNVRQLVHLIQRIVILNDGEALATHMLPQEVVSDVAIGVSPPEREPVFSDSSSVAAPEAVLPMAPVPALFATRKDIVPLDQIERQAISRAIELCDGSAYEAARLLGISSATIYRKIKLFELAMN